MGSNNSVPLSIDASSPVNQQIQHKKFCLSDQSVKESQDQARIPSDQRMFNLLPEQGDFGINATDFVGQNTPLYLNAAGVGSELQIQSSNGAGGHPIAGKQQGRSGEEQKDGPGVAELLGGSGWDLLEREEHALIEDQRDSYEREDGRGNGSDAADEKVIDGERSAGLSKAEIMVDGVSATLAMGCSTNLKPAGFSSEASGTATQWPTLRAKLREVLRRCGSAVTVGEAEQLDAQLNDAMTSIRFMINSDDDQVRDKR